jgi:hypothetical protein
LLLLGIIYNFILPFTPVWVDRVVFVSVALAFLVAYVIDKK